MPPVSGRTTELSLGKGKGQRTTLTPTLSHLRLTARGRGSCAATSPPASPRPGEARERGASQSEARPRSGRVRAQSLGSPRGRPARGERFSRTGGLGAAGFTLLEVLVAFTILALMLTVLLRIFSEGFRGMSAAEVHAAAALHAQAALTSVGAEIPLAAGDWAGERDGFLWRVSIDLYQEPALMASQRSFLLYRVLASAEHASGAGAVTLSGLRVGGSEPSLPGEEPDAGAPQ